MLYQVLALRCSDGSGNVQSAMFCKKLFLILRAALCLCFTGGGARKYPGDI